jgi:hypothetical protein
LRKDIMKSFHSALVLMICLALAGNASAEARLGQHFGTSSSYKSGFSSQKNNAARKPAAPPAGRQSGPGAFGKSAGSPASAQPQRNTSAMSRDVDQSSARANALRNLEARRAAANTQPLPPLNDTLRRPQQAGTAPADLMPQPVYQPPVQQSSGNGLMHGLMGFMLGRAMSQSNQPVSYPTVNGGQQPAAQPPAGAGVGAAAAGAGMVGGMPGLGDAPMVAPAAPQQRSFGASVLRWFIWLSVLSAMVWAALYAVRKLRRLRAGSKPNYSFERN